MTRFASIALLLLLGCEEERPPGVPIPDGSVIRDGGTFDGGPIRVVDAGPTTPVVNGTLGEREWDGATIMESEVETDTDGSTLTSLRALLEEDRLFIGVEGTVASGDSIVIYVDRDLGGAHGVGASGLTDADGALDAVLAQPALSLPAGFQVDFAWGTTRMPFAAVGLDEAIGWRDVTTDPFDPIDAADAPSACTAGACEASIPLSILGGARPRTIALFARIVKATGGLTNQTLPEDDEAAPSVVIALLTVDDGVARDGGMPDGGVEAPGIVIDGVIEADEWASASVFTNTVPAAGGFAGNALTTLRALSDDTHLHVAIEATLLGGNAILMYVDGDLGGADGLVSPTPLTDTIGALDEALAKELTTGAELRIDLAWGTTRMSHGGSDDTMGWRDVATDPSAFRVVAGPSACSATACETSLPLSALGTPGDVALFVRLGSATSLALSNQTLPRDDPSAAESASVFVVLP
jgi:hypothetical protein